MKREKEGEELLDSNFSTDISNKTNKLIFANKKKNKNTTNERETMDMFEGIKN